MQNKREHQPPVENRKPARTPHELLKQHMQHPDEPITDEDMNNLIPSDEETDLTAAVSGVSLSGEEENRAGIEADELSGDATGMAYKAGL